MPTHTWDPFSVLGVNPLGNLIVNTKCIAFTDYKGNPKCRLPVKEGDRVKANNILRQAARLDLRDNRHEVNQLLEQAARALLCGRWHAKDGYFKVQVDVILDRWKTLLDALLEEELSATHATMNASKAKSRLLANPLAMKKAEDVSTRSSKLSTAPRKRAEKQTDQSQGEQLQAAEISEAIPVPPIYLTPDRPSGLLRPGLAQELPTPPSTDPRVRGVEAIVHKPDSTDGLQSSALAAQHPATPTRKSTLAALSSQLPTPPSTDPRSKSINQRSWLVALGRAPTFNLDFVPGIAQSHQKWEDAAAADNINSQHRKTYEPETALRDLSVNIPPPAEIPRIRKISSEVETANQSLLEALKPAPGFNVDSIPGLTHSARDWDAAARHCRIRGPGAASNEPNWPASRIPKLPDQASEAVGGQALAAVVSRCQDTTLVQPAFEFDEVEVADTHLAAVDVTTESSMTDSSEPESSLTARTAPNQVKDEKTSSVELGSAVLLGTYSYHLRERRDSHQNRAFDSTDEYVTMTEGPENNREPGKHEQDLRGVEFAPHERVALRSSIIHDSERTKHVDNEEPVSKDGQGRPSGSWRRQLVEVLRSVKGRVMKRGARLDVQRT